MPQEEQVLAHTGRSCDACRNGKVRCIRDQPGPCQRCRQAAHECIVNRARRSRPFYQTSKEKYELMTTALRHFVPDISFETDDLRNVVSQLSTKQSVPLADNVSPSTSTRQTSNDPSTLQSDYRIPLQHGHSKSHSSLDPTLSNQPQVTARPIITPSPSGSHVSGLDTEINEAVTIPSFYDTKSFVVFLLQAKSSFGCTQRGLHSNEHNIEPNVLHSIQDQSNVPVNFPDDVFLPLQSQVDVDAAVFYAEINSVIYILPSEGLQDCVDRLLRRSERCSNAHIAIVYAIMSLRVESPSVFGLACQYLLPATEEVSIATVEALMLMTLCYLNRSQNNLAWVQLGTAIRIAQALGLHTDTKLWQHESRSILEHRRRLWWSLYDLDIWLSYYLGRPHSIDETVCSVAVPSDSDLTQVPYNPPGYSGLNVHLSRVLARFTASLRLWKTKREQSRNEIRSYITELETWWNGLPAYFKTNMSSPPSYVRALSYLHLRYLHVVMILTRSYLLPDDRGANDAVIENDLTRTCEAANESSLALLHEMRQKGLISRANFQDSHHILATGIVLVVRNLLCPCETHMSELINMYPLYILTYHITIGRAGTEAVRKFVAYAEAAHDPRSSQGRLDNQFPLDVSGLDFIDTSWLDLF